MNLHHKKRVYDESIWILAFDSTWEQAMFFPCAKPPVKWEQQDESQGQGTTQIGHSTHTGHDRQISLIQKIFILTIDDVDG